MQQVMGCRNAWQVQIDAWQGESIALRRRRGSTTFCARAVFSGRAVEEEMIMAWTTPSLIEICIGLEINGYLPAQF
jgi:coenzyme PQQ precursor peptide PqqA